jgi:hypothetical protein
VSQKWLTWGGLVDKKVAKFTAWSKLNAVSGQLLNFFAEYSFES